MSRSETALCLSLSPCRLDGEKIHSQRAVIEKLNVYKLFGISIEDLPFSIGDTTAGSEAELQAVVVGKKENVDLPLTIIRSHYFANIIKRTASGELPTRTMTDLERYLDENADGVWENSWVRFPMALLGYFARRIFQDDLLADKADPDQGNRKALNKENYGKERFEYVYRHQHPHGRLAGGRRHSLQTGLPSGFAVRVLPGRPYRSQADTTVQKSS